MKRVHLIITGIVQGVGFRHFIKSKARILDLKGFVKNTQDNTVEIGIEGEKEKIEAFVEECKKGPLLAKIKNITVQEEPYKGEWTTFEVEH